MTVNETKKYTVAECVGMVVNQYLFDAGIPKKALAIALRVAQTNVSKRIRGFSDWSAEDLIITAELLGLSVADLLPARDSQGNWIPAPFVPGHAKTPAGAGVSGVFRVSESHLGESNSRPIHYE